LSPTPPLTLGDGAILLVLAVLLYGGARLAFHAPAVVAGPEISLSPRALPWYALLSVGRMLAAYVLSLCFTIVYGYSAARNRTAAKVLMPLLDVLQSVPILSFLPVVLLGLSAIVPQGLAAELAAIVLIFTSQAWNMTFSFYQSMITVPGELREAAAVFRLDPWQRFKRLELPFASIGLLWNSMMSWSGGWFFLMAAEIFRVGRRDFRLPGIGSYLQHAADVGDSTALVLGIGMLVVVIVCLDQLVWRPMLAWSDRFKLEMMAGEESPQSWVRDLVSRSWILSSVSRPARRWSESVDEALRRRLGAGGAPEATSRSRGTPVALTVAGAVLGVIVVWGGIRSVSLLSTLPASAWGRIGVGVLATFTRVVVALAIALAWTVPVGVAIGTNRKLAAVLQPVVQIAASVPATALFPVLLLALLHLPGGLNFAAVLLMLMGTQWYLLFNVIAGASAIPQDLRSVSALLGQTRLERWRTLTLPAIFPYVITGAITASAGAWNASIVAEQVEFAGRAYATRGVGSILAGATGAGDYALLLGGTLSLVVVVVLINRTFWLRLYRFAETRFRME